MSERAKEIGQSLLKTLNPEILLKLKIKDYKELMRRLDEQVNDELYGLQMDLDSSQDFIQGVHVQGKIDGINWIWEKVGEIIKTLD